MHKTKLVISNETNPWFNLAFEEQLVNTVSEDEVILYLWQNAHTVVIGKHQNPWREVKVEALESESGKLARRLSGGGAVYHDLGNLNFTFVMHKKHENLEKQLSVLLNAVKSLGIDAAFSGRNDITADGRKFSGNAFYMGKENYYHHGTLLVDVDMQNLGRYLNASVKKLQAKGVASVKSRVINLKELNPDITIENLMAALETAFSEIYGAIEAKQIISEADVTGSAKERYEHYASWDWRYGKTPMFDAEFEERFDWGEVVFHFKLVDAVVSEATVFSDAMSTAFVELVTPAFHQKIFSKESFIEVLKSLDVPSEHASKKHDLLEWFETWEI